MMAGCGGPTGATCSTDDECPSHFCKEDGTCGEAEVDAGDGSADASADGMSELCTPNHDGTIALAELPLVAGRSAKYRIATSATWDTAGTSQTSGSRAWNLAGQLANDADETIALASPTGTWWRDNFPDATYAAPLSAGSDLQGVFAVDSTGVTMLGVVSPEGGTYKTELTYDPPARILAVPFTAGSTWMSSSTVSGFAQGVIVAYTEEYESRVDEVGTMTTPYGDFPVLRVATDLTQTSGLATLMAKRSFAWVAECFGSVATVQSQNFESGTEFDDPAEVRRLAP
jgi:hypothetical protein